jgi:hypothetical protein
MTITTPFTLGVEGVERFVCREQRGTEGPLGTEEPGPSMN